LTPDAPDPSQETPPLPYPRRIDGIARRADALFLSVAAGGLGAFLVWANATEIEKVTRGIGKVIPQQQNQVVQHLEGGIVTEILVKEGDTVAEHQPLLRVSNRFWSSELAQARIEIKAKRIRTLRLDAETSLADTFAVPADLEEQLPRIVERERMLFDSRRRLLSDQLLTIDDQQRQRELEVSELRSRYGNTTKERELVAQRVGSLRRLNTMGAVSTNELLENERALQQMDSKLSDLVHDIPRTEAALSELGRKRGETQSRYRSEAEKERTDTEVQIAKLEEAVQAMQDRSTRSDLLAPISGIVNKLHVSTVGGVVKSCEPLVEIVPSDSAIAVEAKLSPSDRAQVWPGLPAVVKITAYDYSIYGGLKGKVIEVSPDALQDERGQPYFRVRLEAQAADFGANRPVVPGMVADVSILTGKQTVMQAVLNPLRHIRDNALRQ
jgi:HlyD family type I secretion membrane fusion protein